MTGHEIFTFLSWNLEDAWIAEKVIFSVLQDIY